MEGQGKKVAREGDTEHFGEKISGQRRKSSELGGGVGNTGTQRGNKIMRRGRVEGESLGANMRGSTSEVSTSINVVEVADQNRPQSFP
ncbi:hypothetical protein LIER_29369 [Lithospermum erythrorhizon]|uniref:Uncharacterized protein n=1 Tax=Lithospermum erythrorhizon TaxID=34254 RepID=A0AAV3RJW9_LITER